MPFNAGIATVEAANAYLHIRAMSNMAWVKEVILCSVKPNDWANSPLKKGAQTATVKVPQPLP